MPGVLRLCLGSVRKGSVMDRYILEGCVSECTRVCVCISVVQSLLTPSPSFGQVGKHFLKKICFLNLFLAGLDLPCCEGFSLVAMSGGYSPVAVLRHLIVAASLVVEHGLWGVRASGGAGPGLSSCGSQALEHRLNSYGTWA